MPTTRATDGTSIAYDVEGSGPPLVLLHGVTQDRGRFAPLVERLAGGFTCVAVDAHWLHLVEPDRFADRVRTFAATI